MTYTLTVFKQFSMKDDHEMTLTYKNITNDKYQDTIQGWKDAGYTIKKV